MIEAPTIDSLPILNIERRKTDVLCTYITTVFAIALFAAACFRLNPSNLYRLAYPTDGDGRTCGLDFPNFPYVYRTSLTDPSKRLCVNKCPKFGDVVLNCIPTKTLSCKRNHDPAFEVVIYDSHLQVTRSGLFCVPTDTIIRDQLARAASHIDNRTRFFQILDALKIVTIVAFALGIIYLFIIQCFPIGMPRIMIGLGIAGLILIVIFTFLSSSHVVKIVSGFKYIFIVVLAFLIFVMLYTIIKNQIQLRVCSILLKYASMVVSQTCTILIYSLFAIVAVAAVFALAIFQLFCFYSGGDIIKDSFSTFYSSQGTLAKIMTIFICFELVWALFFLKQAFNLLLSGYGVNWYFYSGGVPKAVSPLANLLCYHWGSVVGGSFLHMIFWLPSMILDYIVPSRNQTITSQSFISKITFQCCYGIQGLFDLCRTEAFAYMNLTGLPYCNSCRYVEYIAQSTGVYTGSKSITRIYLLGAHSFIVSVCIMVAVAYLQFTHHTRSFVLILCVIFISFFLTTYFISFHAYIADGILITLLTQQYLAGGFNMMIRAPVDLKQQVFLLLNRPVQVAN